MIPVSYTHLDVYKRQAQYAGPKQKSFGDTGVGPDYEVELAASESNRGDILGNAELDAPYKMCIRDRVIIRYGCGGAAFWHLRCCW